MRPAARQQDVHLERHQRQNFRDQHVTQLSCCKGDVVHSRTCTGKTVQALSSGQILKPTDSESRWGLPCCMLARTLWSLLLPNIPLIAKPSQECPATELQLAELPVSRCVSGRADWQAGVQLWKRVTVEGQNNRAIGHCGRAVGKSPRDASKASKGIYLCVAGSRQMADVTLRNLAREAHPTHTVLFCFLAGMEYSIAAIFSSFGKADALHFVETLREQRLANTVVAGSSI